MDRILVINTRLQYPTTASGREICKERIGKDRKRLTRAHAFMNKMAKKKAISQVFVFASERIFVPARMENCGATGRQGTTAFAGLIKRRLYRMIRDKSGAAIPNSQAKQKSYVI